jgi:DNA binding domain, excisionase family
LIKQSELTKEQYTIGEVAAFLNINVKTIQRWDREGIFKCERTHTNRRVINRDNLIEVLNNRGMLFNDINSSKVDVIYARVSSNEQKAKGDLDRQVSFLVQSVKDLKNPTILTEVGSGLNDKRKKLDQLLDMVLQGKVDRIFVTYQDRLTRFGFHYLEKVCNYHNVKIIVVKGANEEESIQKELTEDMIALAAFFSGKNQKNIKLDDETFNISEIF